MFDSEDPQGDGRETDSNQDTASVIDGRQSIQDYPPVVEEEIQRLKSWYESWKVHMAERETVLQERRQKRMELEKYVRDLEAEKLSLESVLKDEILGRQQAETKLDKCVVNMNDILADEQCVADMIQQYEASREMVLKQDQERLNLFERLKSAYDVKKAEFAEIEKNLRRKVELKETADRQRIERELELEKQIEQKIREGQEVNKRIAEAKKIREEKLQNLANVRTHREEKAAQLKELKDRLTEARAKRTVVQATTDLLKADFTAKQEMLASMAASKAEKVKEKEELDQEVVNMSSVKAELELERTRLKEEKEKEQELAHQEVVIKQEEVVFKSSQPDPVPAIAPSYRSISVNSVDSDYINLPNFASVTPVPTPEPTRLVIPHHSSHGSSVLSSHSSKRGSETTNVYKQPTPRGRPRGSHNTAARGVRRNKLSDL